MLKFQFKSNSLVAKYRTLINEINEFESVLRVLSDSELRIKSFNLKKQYSDTKSLNSLIAESFALTREASQRALGLRHFDVQ
jgi:preprotein translocase subunit SecA